MKTPKIKEPKIGDYEIPFDKNGKMITYPDHFGVQVKWRENFIFSETMVIQGIHRGRSAAHFLFIDSDDNQYPMFMKDLMEMLKSATVKHGKISGRWTFQKRGDNYGVRFLDNKKEVLTTRTEKV